MEDTPYYHYHSQGDLDGPGESSKEEEELVYVKEEEKISAKSAGKRRIPRSENPDDSIDVSAYPDTDPSPNVQSIPKAEEASTDSPQHTSPSPLSSIQGDDNLPSTENHDEPVQDSNKSGHNPLSSNNNIVDETHPSEWTPKMLPTGVRRTTPWSTFRPSPLGQSPVNASEPESPQLPAKALLPKEREKKRKIRISQMSEDLSDNGGDGHSEDSGHASVERGRTTKRRPLPGDAEIDEDETTVDASVGDIISHTVPFQHELPLRFHSHGEAASKLARRTSWDVGDEEDAVIDRLLLSGEDFEASRESSIPLTRREDFEESQESSRPTTESRKRKSSSSPPSPPSPKRSRTSTPIQVSEQRIPLLFVLVSPDGFQHRHVVISLPTSWYEFRQLAIQVFARGSCGPDIPTEISDQAKFIMRWNKLRGHAYWTTFPGETELYGDNINAVLEWMLRSGSYDFCEIQNERETDAVPSNDAISIKYDVVQDEMKSLERLAEAALGYDGDSEKSDHKQARMVSRRDQSSQSQCFGSANVGRGHQTEKEIENAKPTQRTRSNTVIHRPQAKRASEPQEDVEDKSENEGS